MGRRLPYPPGKVWADEQTPYEKAKGCILALPWAHCCWCGRLLLRTPNYRRLACVCVVHGLKCAVVSPSISPLVLPFIGEGNRFVQGWYAELEQILQVASVRYNERAENLLVDVLREVGTQSKPPNRKHRRWLRKHGHDT